MKTETNHVYRIISNKEIQSDGILYVYKLVEDSERYGYRIKVEMLMADGMKSEAATNTIFTTLPIAEDFFKKLYENLATPIDLAYVVEDELC